MFSLVISKACSLLNSSGKLFYRFHKNTKAAADVDYPAYGVTGPNKEVTPTGDRRLAQSAQMYHYQHQKQQIIAMERYENCFVIRKPLCYNTFTFFT